MIRLLIDENVPRQLASLFADVFEVQTIHETPWAGLKNGELVSAVAGQIDVLLTCDQSFKHQQNVSKLPFAVLTLIARSNRLDDLLPLVADARAVITAARVGESYEVRG